MPSNNNRINFQVGYQVDQASVNAVKKSLQDLRNIKIQDFSGTSNQLAQVKDAANKVQIALLRAFNVDLGSVNVQRFTQLITSAFGSVNNLYNRLSQAGSQGKVAFSEVSKSILTTNLLLKLTNSLVSQMGETMANTVKWGIASSIMNNFTNSVQQAFQYVKNLDSSLNDIRIVTKQSSDLMANFAVQANNAAQSLGRSTMDYTKAALTFYQQGLGEELVQARTEATLKAQNITGAGLEMANYLTAVWNGYKVANEEAELYVDKLAAVADSSASNMSLLAVAMSKVASSANLLGVPVDKLNAQIATITATTRQAPETVGNALKTIYSRINDIATGADDAEISLGNYSSKMAEVGISVLDANGRLRDTGDVIDEIGGKWLTLSHEQQIYLSRTMAGQRQYNNLLALFENWSKYSDLVNVSMDAQGTTMEKNSIYLESLSAKMEQFGAAQERVKSALINEEDVKGLVLFGTNAVNVFGNLLLSIGGGKTALLLFGSVFTQLFSGTIAKLLNNIVTHFQNVRDNAEILQRDIANVLLLGKSQGYQDGTIKEMVDAKKEIQQYYSLISALQLKSYNNIVLLIGKSKELVLVLQDQVELALKYKNAILQTANKNGEDFLSQFNLAQLSVLSLTESLRLLNDVRALKNSGNAGLLELYQEARQVGETIGRLTVPQLKLLNDLYKVLQERETFENLGIPLEAEWSRFLTLIRQVKDLASQGMHFAEGFLPLNNSLQLAEARLDNAIQKAKDFQAAIQQFSSIKGIVDTASALGRFAGAINSLQNLRNIWSNLNLSGGQKFLQIMSNLGMTIPMLVSAYKTLQKATQGLSNSMLNASKITEAVNQAEQTQITLKEARKAVTQASIAVTKGLAGAEQSLAAAKEVEAAASVLATSAQLALNVAMAANPIGAIITGITLAITAIYGLVKVYDYFTMSVELANEAVDAFNEKQKLLNTSKQTLNQQTSELQELEEEYDKLASKAGAINFDSTIDNLTLAERDRYNLIKDLIAQYNDDAISGYTEQGLVILKNNDALRLTILLLKEKHQLEIDSYLDSKLYKEAQEGKKVQYLDLTVTGRQSIKDRKLQDPVNFSNSLTTLTSDLSYFGGAGFLSEYNEQLEEIYNIQNDGILKIGRNKLRLELLFDEFINIPGAFTEDQIETLKADRDNFREIIRDFLNISFDLTLLELKIADSIKISPEDILFRLSGSDNIQYHLLAENYGESFVNNILTAYINGMAEEGKAFTYNSEQGNDIESSIRLINQDVLSIILNIGLSSSQIKAMQYNIAEEIGNFDFSKITIKQYKDNIEGIILNIIDSNLELLLLAKTNPEILESILQSLFGADSIKIGFDKNGNLFVDEYVDNTTDLIEQGNKKILLRFKDSQPHVAKFAKEWLANASILSQQQIDEILSYYEDGIGSVEEKMQQAAEKAKQAAGVWSAQSTMGLLGRRLDLDDEEESQLLDQLEELHQKYPEISNAVTILETDWMRSTSSYQDALRDTNNLLLQVMYNAKEAGVMDQEQISASLTGLISDSETLQSALAKLLITTLDYSNVLGRLGSQYESCQDLLNAYVQALRAGDEQTRANATATLLLSVRSALLALATGLSANQIEKVAAQLASENEVLQQNSELAADAAVRYIRLNTAVEDLYTNADDYLDVFTRFSQGDIGAIDLWLDLKEVIADVFDTSSSALGDDWISLRLERIIQMAETGGLGLLELRLEAAELILAHVGIDFEGFEDQKDEFLNRLADIQDEADLLVEMDIDDIVFLQKLVTAMLQAGYAQSLIESYLSGMNIDVDLTPYREGLNTALDLAMQLSDLHPIVAPLLDTLNYNAELANMVENTGQAFADASDAAALQGGIDAKTTTLSVVTPQQTIIPGQTFETTYASGTFTYPVISGVPGDSSYSVSPGNFVIRYPQFIPVPTTEVAEGLTTAVATGLEVIGAHKKGGGKISHYNKPVARQARAPKSGGSGKGGGGGSKAKTVKPSTDKITTKPKEVKSDPYEKNTLDLERQSDLLENQSDLISLIQRQNDKLATKDRAKGIDKLNQALEDQIDKLKEELKLLKQRLKISDDASKENTTANLRARLAATFENELFGDDGQIENQSALLKLAADRYNAVVERVEKEYAQRVSEYNKLIQTPNIDTSSLKEQLDAVKKEYQDLITAAELAYKKETDLLKDYSSAVKADIDTRKKLVENAKEQQLALLTIYLNRIIKSKIIVDASIDAGDLLRLYLDFENKFIKKLSDDNIVGQAQANMALLMSYFDSEQVKQTANLINRLRNEIAIMNKGGVSDIYGTNLIQAQLDLNEYLKQLMDQLKDIQDLVDDIKDNYLDALDDAKDKMDDQIDQYERINDLVEHNVKLTQLLYGDTAYNSMDKYYQLQEANNERELMNLRTQQDYWQRMMNSFIDANGQIIDQEAFDKAKANLDDLTDQLNSKMELMIENLSTMWLNRVDGIIARLNNALTAGRGLDYLDSQWDYINDFDDAFLDTVESKMGIQEVESLYQLAIDGLTGSPAQQQKINKLMLDQLKLLREKDNLTLYDIERAKASLEVEKARLALEEARDNKTKMRLRRDSQGNYTYQYVADEEKLSDLQSALADAQANLYETDKDHYRQNLNDLYDAYKEYLEKRRALEEEYNQATPEEQERIQGEIDLLDTAFNKMYNALSEDNLYLLNEYLSNSFADAMELDKAAYDAEEFMQIMKDNIPQVSSNIQDLVNKINGLGGLIPATKDAIEEMKLASGLYQAGIDQVLSTGGTSRDELFAATDAYGQALDRNIQQAQNLIPMYDELIDKSVSAVQLVKNVMDLVNLALDSLISQGLVNDVTNAYNLAQNLNGVGSIFDLDKSAYQAKQTMNDYGLTNMAALEYTNLLSSNAAAAALSSVLATTSTSGDIDINNLIPTIVTTVDTMMKTLQGITSSLISAIGKLVDGYIGRIDNVENLNQNVHILANFPNVTQHTEIEQAFNNLVNMASMYASKYNN